MGGDYSYLCSTLAPCLQELHKNSLKHGVKILECSLELTLFCLLVGLLFRFSYDELSAAVKERYCEDESTMKHYLMLLIEYFDALLKVNLTFLNSDSLF